MSLLQCVLPELKPCTRCGARQKWIADGNAEDDFEWDRPLRVVKKMFKIALHESRLDDEVRAELSDQK